MDCTDGKIAIEVAVLVMHLNWEQDTYVRNQLWHSIFMLVKKALVATDTDQKTIEDFWG